MSLEIVLSLTDMQPRSYFVKVLITLNLNCPFNNNLCIHVCNGPLWHGKSTTKEQIIREVNYEFAQKCNFLLLKKKSAS